MSPARPTRLRRTLVAAAMVFAALIGALGLQAPAWAASCPSGYICHWQNAVYSGTQYAQYTRSGGVCVSYPSWFNDLESSTWNATARKTRVQDNHCAYAQTFTYNLGAGARIANWVSVCWWCNDEWSSTYFY